MRRHWFYSGFIKTFGTLGLFKTATDIISEATIKPYEAGSFDNHRLYRQDLDKVIVGEMSQNELEKNIRSGKYRDYSPLPDYDLWISRIEKYMKLFPNRSHTMDKIHLDYVKEHKERRQKLDESILWKYKYMDDK